MTAQRTSTVNATRREQAFDQWWKLGEHNGVLPTAKSALAREAFYAAWGGSDVPAQSTLTDDQQRALERMAGHDKYDPGLSYDRLELLVESAAQAAKDVLSSFPSAQSMPDMARLSASEVACYRWPEDTAEHRAMREAFCDGAAHIAPAQGSRGCDDIAAERQRQMVREGWTPAHDDEHTESDLASAALCYVYVSIFDPGDFPLRYWPWDRKWWKPSDARRNLVKAGALIAAEIDRLDRASALPSTDGSTP
jgi:hypothetical protein